MHTGLALVPLAHLRPADVLPARFTCKQSTSATAGHHRSLPAPSSCDSCHAPLAQRAQGCVARAANSIFDNLDPAQPDREGSNTTTTTGGSSSSEPSDRQASFEPAYRPLWQDQSTGISSPGPSSRTSSGAYASTSQQNPVADVNGSPAHSPPDLSRSQAGDRTADTARQASTASPLSGPELQASSWEPWYDKQEVEGWDDWGSPQRPSKAEPRWGPAQQPQPPGDPAGPSTRSAEQASSGSAADTAYTFTPEDVQRGADLPDLTELTEAEKERLLPLTPSAEQIKRASGNTLDVAQRIGVAALVSLVTVKVVLLATGAVLFPLWGPVWTAYNRNQSLRQRGRHVALWRAQVLDYEVLGRPRGWNAGRSAALPDFAGPVLRLMVGDTSGARTELLVPHRPEFNVIAQGEPAELLALSPGRTFKSFQALKEVYLPEAGVWVADYPYINRDLFLGFSLEVERERQGTAQQPT